MGCTIARLGSSPTKAIARTIPGLTMWAGTDVACLFRLDGGPSGGCSEGLVSVIAKHGARQRHELEVGSHLANVAQDEVHLLLLTVEGFPNLCTCGLQLAPAKSRLVHTIVKHPMKEGSISLAYNFIVHLQRVQTGWMVCLHFLGPEPVSHL